MGGAFTGRQIGCPVTDNEVFGGDKHTARPVHRWVEINLPEGRASQRQREQHPFRFGAVLCHFLCDEIIQVVLYPVGLFFLLGINGTDNIGSHGAAGRE